MKKAREIAEWIWRESGLDHEESWNSMMIEDATEEIGEIIDGE